jgi:hypothetical protein
MKDKDPVVIQLAVLLTYHRKKLKLAQKSLKKVVKLIEYHQLVRHIIALEIIIYSLISAKKGCELIDKRPLPP